MSSLSRDNNIKKEGKELLKPIKPRKAVSNNKDNFDSSLSVSAFNFPNINLIKLNKEKDEFGITGRTSSSNVNSKIHVFSCRSRAGNQVDGSRKTNQDSYLANTKILNVEDFCTFGVYDGHGKIIFS